MFKFVVELDHCTARSQVPTSGQIPAVLSVPQSFSFCVTCMREAESLSGFNLKHAALLLTNGPSWFLETYCFTLSSPHLPAEWVMPFANLSFLFVLHKMYFYWISEPKVFNLEFTDGIQGP